MPHHLQSTLANLDHCQKHEEDFSRCEVFINVSNRFLGLLAWEASRDSDNDTSREYPFVAMDSRQVFRQLALARRQLDLEQEEPASPAPSFLDVGCGIGNVMLLAEQMGFEVYGLEKDRKPCAVARKLFGPERVSDSDIWEYREYHRFQVIYYFRPFADRQLQQRFEKMIEDKLQPGGILIANHKNSDIIDTDSRFSRLHPELPAWCKR
ncbi:class I SAM-dependent methyltransferase [Desulfurivibrio dismutans]|uniref:class I SAM-dependent methyltransferase n=1 Tax=Desulfurivibrio dismutans TaxID=1398908 RepID=UPI0023DCBBB6|nr:class I SAM-dependent methyltransferase [Desulfurivibrio alkaliphilus]MDF1615362.1 class I SAM-dependent methyltransferase [Desulfurivibrio alkaliphilus]